MNNNQQNNSKNDTQVGSESNELPPLPQENTMPSEGKSIEDKKKRGRLPWGKKKDEKGEEPKEKVVEKVVIKEKVRRGGLLNTGIGCRTFFSLGCLIIILSIVGIVALFIFKPSSLWDKTVSFLNSNLEVYEYDGTTYDSAISAVNEQVTEVGNNEVVLTENQLTALSRKNISQLENIQVDVQTDKLFIFWELDNSIENEPLYGLFEFKQKDSGELYINKFGTNRISTPRFLNKYLNDVLMSTLKIGSDQEDNYVVIRKLIALNEDAEITQATLEDDTLKLTVNVGVNLFE